MPLQNLIKVLTVGPLAGGAQVTIDTGISEENGPRCAWSIMPDQATAIAVVGNPAATPFVSTVTFKNLGLNTETATFFVWRVHTFEGFDPTPGRYWRGLGPNVVQGLSLTGATGSTGPSGPPAPGGTFGNFFALMPGDNAATIAVGAAVLFPQNGPANGIVRSSSSQIFLPAIGIYDVFFQVSVAEAGQLMLGLDSGAGVVELAPTVAGRATGTSQIVQECFVATTVLNSLLTVRNPTGNAAALTLTPSAGGTHAVSAQLVIQRIL